MDTVSGRCEIFEADDPGLVVARGVGAAERCGCGQVSILESELL